MIYSDNGAAQGNRTRLFRNTDAGTVEWMFGVDYAAGSTRWYAFGMGKDSVEDMQKRGQWLTAKGEQHETYS